MSPPDPAASEPRAASARSWRGAAAMWAAILVGTLAPLARYWVAGLTLIHRDQPTYFAPLRWIAGQALREGRLPLWNPYNATGMPFLGLMTHGALHPLSVLVAFLFPSDGLDPLMGAYFLLSGVGSGLFARSLGASRAASVLAAFAYALSGYMLSTTSNINNLTGTASVPWILLGLRLAARDRTAASFALGALAIAGCALCGDVQELAVATVLGLVLALDVGGRRGAAVAAGAVALGALLGAIQLVPSWTFLGSTHRILPLPAYDVNQWDLEPWRLVELLTPGFYWAPEDGTSVAPVYMALGHPTSFQVPYSESVLVGGAVLVLAAAGARISRTTKLLVAAAAVVLWIAMGHHLGARTLQDLLPLARGFRYGEKFLPAALACVAALAALGADRLASSRTAAMRAAVVAAAGAAALGAAWVLLRTDAAGRLFAGVASGEVIREHVVRGLPHPIVACAALAGCLWLAARGRKAAAQVGMALVVWGAAAAAAPYGLRPGHREARIDVAPPHLAAAPPGPRVLAVRVPRERDRRPDWDVIDEFVFGLSSGLVANTNARHRIDSFEVDSGFFPLRWYQLHVAAGEDVALAARRFAVTHLLFPTPETDQGKRIVQRITGGAQLRGTEDRSGMEIWEVPHRPWASFPEEVVAVADGDAALRAVLQTDDPGWRRAFVETLESLPAAPGRVLSVRRELERVEVVAEASAEATLVVNDAYWRGWRAWIDGRETPIYAADGLVRAVLWPTGRHTLVMQYEPREVRVGLWLSASGLAILLVVCVLLRRGSRPQPAAP